MPLPPELGPILDAVGHNHDHGHGGHHHHHGVSAQADGRWLGVALAVILVFFAVEVVAGVLAGSLALLSDAGHMLLDAGSLVLALVALQLASRPPSRSFTFGLGRAEILSAQVNGASLLVLAGVIAVAALRRIGHPPDVEGAVVVIVGVIGAAANVGAALALARAERQSLNVAGARAHVMADLFSSLTAIVAGVVVLATGFREADGIAALLVAALMVRSGWSLLRESGRVLLEAAPRGIDAQDIGRTLAAQPGVREVHDLHVWEVTSGFPALAAHVMVASGEDCHSRRRELQQLLRDRFAIQHTTLQVDHEPAQAQLLEISRAHNA